MYEFQDTIIEGKQGRFEAFHDFFEGQGYELGGGWEYDHGYFDKQLELKPSYLFVRVPAFVEEGTIGDSDAVLRLGAPFVLNHQYDRGDDDNTSGLISSLVNQFSEPEDADAPVTEEALAKAEEELQKLERAFQQKL